MTERKIQRLVHQYMEDGELITVVNGYPQCPEELKESYEKAVAMDLKVDVVKMMLREVKNSEDTVYLMRGCKEVFDICMICKDYTKMVYKLTPEESEGIFSRTGCYGTSRYQNKMLNELWEGSIDIKSNKETFGIMYEFEFKQRPYKGKEIRVRKLDFTKEQ